MKRYLSNSVHLPGIRMELGTTIPVYLASDFDRLRAEARERLAKFIAKTEHSEGVPCTSCYSQADEYLGAIFGEEQT